MRHPARLRRHDVSDEKGAEAARRGRLAELQNLVLELARRVYHRGHPQPGRADRPVRRRRTAHHGQIRGRVRRRVQADGHRGRKRDYHPQDQDQRERGQDHEPALQKVYRFFGNDTGKAIADYLCVHDETVDDSSDLEIFDPQATWKRKRVYNFTAKELLVPIFKNGELVYKLPKLDDIQKYCAEQVDTLWDEVKRFDNPHTYYVDLSQKLWDIKDRLLHEGGRLDR